MVLAEEKVFRTGSAIYRCLSELGRGQTATVYRAVREDCQGHTRQVVALKVLNSRASVQSLRHEFEVLSKMRSHHCAKVLAWENLGDGTTLYPALVLEWIEGASLHELHRENLLQSNWSTEIVRQIEVGLQDLEANGLHHGDLSPANIMVDRRGRVRLIDFASDPEMARGTINYIAPERWTGAGLSIETDLFALGLIEHDLLSGFQDLTNDEPAAQGRAIRLARAEPGFLLSIHPESRDYRNSAESIMDAEQMGLAIHDYLNRKLSVNQETRAIQEPASLGKKTERAWYFRVAGIAAALTIPISIAVQAQAPREIGDPVRGALNVATHSWVHLWLNGRDVGYSPIRVGRLLPGTHRLHWQTARKSGELQIQLSPGAQLKLSEDDFSKLE